MRDFVASSRTRTSLNNKAALVSIGVLVDSSHPLSSSFSSLFCLCILTRGERGGKLLSFNVYSIKFMVAHARTLFSTPN
jgi:hypothetical protein